MSCTRLETERLLLRPPSLADVASVVAIANDYDVAKNLSKLPHPYTQKDAEDFVARASENRALGSDFAFAITRKHDGAYMGGICLHLKDGKFEFGYWLGKPYWRQGYATEAARRLVAFAFHDLKADSVWAGWYHDNPASGHVLEKLGCKPNGAEPRDCLARGHAVYCHLVILSREDFWQKKAA